MKYIKFHSDLLSSVSAVKQIVKFFNMPMQELRADLEGVLEEHKLTYMVNSSTDDNIQFNIANGSVKTVLELTRHRHKPLEVEIVADHKLNSTPDYVKRKKPSSGANNNRLLWYGIFLFGFIVMMLSVFVSMLIGIIETVTPGWNSTQRALGIFALTTLGVFYWWYIIPYFNRQKVKSVFTLNTQIVALIKLKLDSIYETASKTSVIRCWSCFKEIQIGDEFCEHCGKSQV